MLKQFFRVHSRLSLALLLSSGVAIGTLPHKAVAQNNYTWKGVAMGGGGYVTGLVAHPSVSGLVYARTDVGGAYRWNGTDGWIPLFDWSSAANNWNFGVNSLAVDGKDSSGNVVYAACGKYTGSNGDVYKSSNRGETWVSTNLKIPIGGNEGYRMSGERLVVDPNNSANVYYGSNKNGLYRSTNANTASMSWSSVTGLPAGNNGAGITFVAFDQNSPLIGGSTSVIYAGVWDEVNGGIYRSTNAGGQWTKLGGAAATRPWQGRVAPDGSLFVTHTGGVVRCSRSSSSFVNITPPESGRYCALSVDIKGGTTSPQTVVVSRLDYWSGLSVFRSTNSGESGSWTRLNSISSVTNTVPWQTFGFGASTAGLLIDPSNSNRIWLSDWYNIWRMDNANAANPSWMNYTKGHEELVNMSMISPTTGAPLISAHADVATLRHSSLSTYPTQRATVPSTGDDTGLDFCESDGNFIARVGGRNHGDGVGGGGYSLNNGATWTAFSGSFGKNGKIAVGATKNGTFPILVVAPNGTDMKRSTDGGATWSSVIGAPSVPVNDFWTKHNPVASDRVNGNKFYVVKQGMGYADVYASTNGGANWSLVAAPGQSRTITFEWSHIQLGSLRAVPGREGEVWLSLVDAWSGDAKQGLWRITGAGTSNPVITRLANVSPTTDKPRSMLYAFGKAPAGQSTPTLYVYGKVNGVEGIFRSDNAIALGGDAASATWTQVYDHAIQKKGITAETACMEADRQVYGRVYLSSGGRGIWVGEIGGTTPTNPNPNTGTNLVSNPSFDAEDFDTQTPSGWSENQYDASWNSVAPTASYTEANGGSYSGARHGTHYSPSAYRVHTFQLKTGLANGLYTFRGRARSSGGQSQCYLEVKNYGGTARTANLPVSSTYQLVEIKDINVTNGQCTIGIWSSANAGNWANFDDLEFIKQ